MAEIPRLPLISNCLSHGSLFEFVAALHGGSNHRTVVATAQAAIAGQHQHVDDLTSGSFGQQRMRDVQSASAKILDDLRNPLGVVVRRRGAIHGFLESRGSDQFHRSRNLANVSNRLASLVEFSNIGHGIYGFSYSGFRFQVSNCQNLKSRFRSEIQLLESPLQSGRYATVCSLS